jgi:predicted dehydrogenase
MDCFLGSKQARVVAVCDVNALRRDDAQRRVDSHYGGKGCAAYGDFRELIARDDIDVVHCATPDHWHVLVALEAARAGKDMYVEKPLGLSLAWDQALRNEIQLHGNVFQFGTQHRSERNFRFACELVRNGRIGKLHTMHVALDASKVSPNFPPMPVPDTLDYDMWLGPAPYAPFTENRIINKYWWHISDYTLGFVAGQNIHFADIAQWANGTEHTGPIHVEGWGKFPKEGLTDCATAYAVRHTFKNGVVMHLTDDVENPMGIKFEGTEGYIFVNLGYIDAEPKSILQTVFAPEENRLYQSNNHVENLLDCYLLPVFHQRVVKAIVGAQAACGAAVIVDTVPCTVEDDRPRRTNVETSAAVRAEAFYKADLPLRRDALGVGAPGAAEAAAFQEYDRPDARSVMDGIALDIRDDCLHTVPRNI